MYGRWIIFAFTFKKVFEPKKKILALPN